MVANSNKINPTPDALARNISRNSPFPQPHAPRPPTHGHFALSSGCIRPSLRRCAIPSRNAFEASLSSAAALSASSRTMRESLVAAGIVPALIPMLVAAASRTQSENAPVIRQRRRSRSLSPMLPSSRSHAQPEQTDSPQTPRTNPQPQQLTFSDEEPLSNDSNRLALTEDAFRVHVPIARDMQGPPFVHDRTNMLQMQSDSQTEFPLESRFENSLRIDTDSFVIRHQQSIMTFAEPSITPTHDELYNALQIVAFISKHHDLRMQLHDKYEFNIYALIEAFASPNVAADIRKWAIICMRSAFKRDAHPLAVRRCGSLACLREESHPREFSKCSRCRRVAYCNKTCQRHAWQGHRNWCVPSDPNTPSQLNASARSNLAPISVAPFQIAPSLNSASTDPHMVDSALADPMTPFDIHEFTQSQNSHSAADTHFDLNQMSSD